MTAYGALQPMADDAAYRCRCPIDQRRKKSLVRELLVAL